MKVIKYLMTVLLLSATVIAQSQNVKVSKDARKEAKKLVKEGWVVAPGALPLERQLDRAYQMREELGDDLSPKYFVAEGMSIGEVYDAAKMQAMETAKLALAGKIQTDLTAKVSSKIGNMQDHADEATSISQSIMAAKSLISQSLPRVATIVEAYRVLPNRNREVLVMLACSSNAATDAAKNAVRTQLEKDGKKIADSVSEWLK